MVYDIPDQKAERVVKLLCEEIVPFFGVPEALLSDRGTNLLSHIMRDVCKLLGVEKLNTTAYHPECDGMVERLNRTLKTMLRKKAVDHSEIDIYLDYSGHTAIHHMSPKERSRHFFSLGGTAVLRQKLNYYQ